MIAHATQALHDLKRLSETSHSLLADKIGPIPISLGVNERVQERLLQLIRQEKLAGGDRLPFPAELCQAMAISQATPRRAMRSLEAVRMFAARLGSEWYVQDCCFDPIVKGMAHSLELSAATCMELIDRRASMECDYLERAWPRLSEDDPGALSATVDALEWAARANQVSGGRFVAEACAQARFAAWRNPANCHYHTRSRHTP